MSLSYEGVYFYSERGRECKNNPKLRKITVFFHVGLWKYWDDVICFSSIIPLVNQIESSDCLKWKLFLSHILSDIWEIFKSCSFAPTIYVCSIRFSIPLPDLYLCKNFKKKNVESWNLNFLWNQTHLAVINNRYFEKKNRLCLCWILTEFSWKNNLLHTAYLKLGNSFKYHFFKNVGFE